MKRLTIRSEACVEALALLIIMAWADGRLEESEKEGVRAAAAVLNLTKELRDRLDELLKKPIQVEELLVDELNAREKAFAYVAAAWLSGVDANVDAKEKEVLARAATHLGISAERQRELEAIARDLEPLREGKPSWSTEVIALFKAIPARFETDADAYEVAFE
jgi:uncharacterized membrane protein YebE (DUF533 family)